MDEICIRPAGPEDEQGILRCLTEAFEPFRSYYSAEAFADTVLDKNSLRERMKSMHVLVARASETVVATVAARLDATHGHLRGMAVVPQWQRTGLASQLLGSAEDWLRERHCRRITLDTTLPLAGAMKFYEKNGYKRSGRVTDFFGMPLLEYEKQLR